MNDCLLITILISLINIECSPVISNVARFIYPVTIVFISIFNIFYAHNKWHDVTLSFFDGTVSIKEIELACHVQIILFGWTLIFRVFYDPKHLKFSIVGTKIRRSDIIPNIIARAPPQASIKRVKTLSSRNGKDSSNTKDIDINIDRKKKKMLSANFDDTMTETTEENDDDNYYNNYGKKKNRNKRYNKHRYSKCDYFIYTIIVLCGLFLLFVFIIQFESIHIYYGDCFSCIVFVILSIFILYKYCYFRLFAYFIHEFRCCMLFSSIIVIFICTGFEITWRTNDKYNVNSNIVITKYYESSVFDEANRFEWYNHVTQSMTYNMAIFLCIARDAMIVPFPHILSLFLIITLLLTSMYAIFEDTFGYWCVLYPSWFLFLQKEAYCQVSLLMILLLYHMFINRNQDYFVLIVGKLKRDIVLKALKNGKFNNIDNMEIDETEYSYYIYDPISDNQASTSGGHLRVFTTPAFKRKNANEYVKVIEQDDNYNDNNNNNEEFDTMSCRGARNSSTTELQESLFGSRYTNTGFNSNNHAYDNSNVNINSKRLSGARNPSQKRLLTDILNIDNSLSVNGKKKVIKQNDWKPLVLS